MSSCSKKPQFLFLSTTGAFTSIGPSNDIQIVPDLINMYTYLSTISVGTPLKPRQAGGGHGGFLIMPQNQTAVHPSARVKEGHGVSRSLAS
jgi:hypothetical protein